ncbi:helix-turn-helix domain-containing protein [Rhodopseudomonas parapalustris]
MFKDRLKELRQDRDLTQAELSKIIGVSREMLSGYENTGREPNFSILIKIADYFDVSTDYILCRTNKKYPFDKYK